MECAGVGGWRWPLHQLASLSAACSVLCVAMLQVLQIFSPLGHALGLSVVSSALEDSSLATLFAGSYASVQRWAAEQRGEWLARLTVAQARLLRALEGDVKLARLGVVVGASVRAKSAFSMMKKVLQLSGAHLRALYSLVHLDAVLVPSRCYMTIA